MRVLLADDDPVSHRIVHAHLERAGFSVQSATDGRQALAKALAPGAPALLLLDWMMPGLEGPDLIRELRFLQPDRFRYMVLLSERGCGRDLVDGFAAGADDYLRKPFDPGELVARLRVGQRMLGLQERLRATNEDLERLASVDPLTGVPNRRTVMARLRQASVDCFRDDLPMGVAMIDIDHFKRINDRHGHQVGDRVLEIVAKRLHGQLRPGATLGRVGGEEFLVVAPGADFDATWTIAERLCAAVSEHPVAAPNARLAVTCSVGIGVGLAGSPHSAEELIRHADIALYQAKSGGRNCVCSHVSRPQPFYQQSQSA